MAIDVQIRDEETADRDAVLSVEEAAFGRSDGARLIIELREEGVILASLVAICQKSIVGHILFTRMEVVTPEREIPAAALAPMAVLPSMQRNGIGSGLIRAGLDRLRTLGEQVVFVLGHPTYYTRFGFSAEASRPIESPFPPEAFMAFELTPNALKDVRGRVRYPNAFGLPSR